MASEPSEYSSLWHAHSVRIPTRVFASPPNLVRHVASMVEQLIRARAAEGRNCVLGLPTGSTPVGVYRELVRRHREEGLSFANVITFNLDEYFPMAPTHAQSYACFMQEHLFKHIDIKKENIHIPDGMTAAAVVDDYCARYEEMIRQAGGLDLVLLGIGRTGHIAFNEPGSPHMARTRLTQLDPLTRKDAANTFFGEDNVPTLALTMGTATITESRRVVLMALGEHKAAIVRRALEEGITENCPASVLQRHPDALFLLDAPAASELTFYQTPWRIGRTNWTPSLVRKSVLWLSMETGKALLKLTDDDFRAHNLHEPLRAHGPADKLCRQVFDDMIRTICDEPAGRERKRVLCFSPHPDDDVISMGGTLLRMRQQNHDVHVAYMTSGNVAVFDHDALRFAHFASDFNRAFGLADTKTRTLEQKIRKALSEKKSGDIDADEVLLVKSLVRKTEAIAAAKVVGIDEACCHFLDLPFYHTGRVSKKPPGDEDLQRVLGLFAELKPDLVYVAGDLADPHGTHRVCAELIFRAVIAHRAAGNEVDVMLYRGAWQEYEPHQVEFAVPLSPSDLERKKAAIFRHQSQKDEAMFPGSDEREFWQRAEDRNKTAAAQYNQLGLPEYYALECFVRWKGEMP